MKIAVTGATGYIGERFIKQAVVEGHGILALSRRHPEMDVSHWIPYELSSRQVPILPKDTEVVLHLASRTSADEPQLHTQEILAAELLIKAAQNVGAKFIFVSSQTARPDAPTAYGRTKWNIEQHILAAGGCVVRPGQVYGGKPRGLFGELLHTVRRLPVLPAFLPAPMVQPIHVDDLALGLLRITERVEICPRVLRLGSPEPVTFTEFLRAIAHVRLRLWRRFVPIPTLVISAATRLISKQTNLGRLRSLFDLPIMDTAADLRRLGLQLRPLNSGMHPAGDACRRQLLVEGLALLSYILKAQPGHRVLRRYVRAIEKFRGSKALSLPKLFMQWPILLSIIDGGNRTATVWKEEFVWRLDAATVLAEATPFGARRFIGQGEPHGFARSVFGITCAILAEVGWRILSILVAPVTRAALPRSLGKRQ